MEDRFLFRAWDGERMIDPSFLISTHEHRVLFNADGFLEICYRYYNCDPVSVYKGENNEVELMQCTGIKDTNGRLIYEGDIVVEKNLLVTASKTSEVDIPVSGVVSHQDFAFYWKTFKPRNVGSYEVGKRWKERESRNKNIESYYLRQVFVVGNIYENPELLKGGE